jgi:hypothetical protein
LLLPFAAIAAGVAVAGIQSFSLKETCLAAAACSLLALIASH